MTKEELKSRTKNFALRIIKVVEELPQTTAGWAIGKQLIRSGTSVAANYRAACRARSTRDFVAKIALVEEEADESLFWLEMIVETALVKKERLAGLLQEADELTAIFTATGRSTKLKQIVIKDSTTHKDAATTNPKSEIHPPRYE